MSNRLREDIERDHHKNRRNVYAKISKRVFYNGKEFESGRALAKHLNLAPNSIYKIIKKGSYNGIPVKYA